MNLRLRIIKMYFGLSEDQEFFQENIKKFLDDNASVDVIRKIATDHPEHCLLYTSPSPRDKRQSRMPSSA